MQYIVCPSCGDAVVASGLSASLVEVQCPRCSTHFRVAEHLRAAGTVHMDHMTERWQENAPEADKET